MNDKNKIQPQVDNHILCPDCQHQVTPHACKCIAKYCLLLRKVKMNKVDNDAKACQQFCKAVLPKKLLFWNLKFSVCGCVSEQIVPIVHESLAKNMFIQGLANHFTKNHLKSTGRWIKSNIHNEVILYFFKTWRCICWQWWGWEVPSHLKHRLVSKYEEVFKKHVAVG